MNQEFRPLSIKTIWHLNKVNLSDSEYTWLRSNSDSIELSKGRHKYTPAIGRSFSSMILTPPVILVHTSTEQQSANLLLKFGKDLVMITQTQSVD